MASTIYNNWLAGSSCPWPTQITETQAIAEYGADGEVVVCGDDEDENRELAKLIAGAVGRYK